MSLLRTYECDPQLSLQDLETWVQQTEDVTQARVTAIKAYKTSKMTQATVDLSLSKPSRRARVRMGHISLGPDAVQGQAYVLGQAADVTIDRA
jgi:Tfp pilus assembly protein PilP